MIKLANDKRFSERILLNKIYDDELNMNNLKGNKEENIKPTRT